jgi:DNA repair protein RadC
MGKYPVAPRSVDRTDLVRRHFESCRGSSALVCNWPGRTIYSIIADRFDRIDLLSLLKSRIDDQRTSRNTTLINAIPEGASYDYVLFTISGHTKQVIEEQISTLIASIQLSGPFAVLSRTRIASNRRQQNYLDYLDLINDSENDHSCHGLQLEAMLKAHGLRNIRASQSSTDFELDTDQHREKFGSRCLKRLSDEILRQPAKLARIEALGDRIRNEGIEATGREVVYGQTIDNGESTSDIACDISELLGISRTDSKYTRLLNELRHRNIEDFASSSLMQSIAAELELPALSANKLIALSRILREYVRGSDSSGCDSTCSTVEGEVKSLRKSVVEEIVALYLDEEGKLRMKAHLARGSETSANLDIMSALRPAVINGFRRILLLHNHPSGNSVPSVEDMHFSRTFSAAAAALGITLVDHLIVGENDTASALK